MNYPTTCADLDRVLNNGQRLGHYVEGMVVRGRWRQEIIPAEVLGLSRDRAVFWQERRSSHWIVEKWHGDGNTFCPPVWADLAIGTGPCGLACRSCYLMLTHRVRRDPWRHVLYEPGQFWPKVADWLADPRRQPRHTLGLGIDRSDSLLYEGLTGHARTLIPTFADPERNPQGCKLILVTRSANTHYLAGLPTANVVVSTSLNPPEAAALWEGVYPDDGRPVPPPVETRVRALLEAQRMGFECRLRLDPAWPGMEARYRAWFARLKALGFGPMRLTLGSYREKNPMLDLWREYWGLPPLDPRAEAILAHHKAAGADGTHIHLGRDVQVEMYAALIRAWREAGPGGEVGLCKTSYAVRRALGLRHSSCNCMA